MSRRPGCLLLPSLLALPLLACGGDEVTIGTQPPDAGASPDALGAEPDAAPDMPLQLDGTWSRTQGPFGDAVQAFATNGTRLYAATYRKLYKSDDDGLTWQELMSLPYEPTSWITALAAQGDELAVAVNDLPAHIMISYDQGATFATDVPTTASLFSAQLYFAGDRLIFEDSVGLSAIDPGASATVPVTLPADVFPFDIFSYAASGDAIVIINIRFGQTELWASPDEGATWALSTGTPSNPAPYDQPYFTGITAYDGLFYLAGVNLVGDQGWSSPDGNTWTGLGADPPGLIGRDTQVALAGGWLYRFDQYHIERSTLSPVAWADDTASFGSVMETPIFYRIVAHDGQVFVASMDQDVYRRAATGEWLRSNDGMLAPNIPALAESDGAVVASIGFGKLMHSVDGGATWEPGRHLPHGYGANALLGRPGLILAGDGRNGIYRSTDGGVNWLISSSGYGQYNGQAGLQYREVAGFAATDGAIYVATAQGLEGAFEGDWYETGGGVFRSDDGGLHWSEYNEDFPIMSAGFSGPRYDPCTAIHVFGGAVLVGTEHTHLLRNDGAGWVPSDTGLPSAEAVVAFADDGTTIWAALDSGSAGNLFRSDDGGHTWSYVPTGLTGMKISSVTWRQGTLIVAAGSLATDTGGVYQSIDGGSTWTLVGDWDTAAGGAAISTLLTDSALYTGTSTHGLWKLDIDVPN